MRGVPGDNTLGTNYGTHLAFDMSNGANPLDRALLVSADLDNTAQYCFQFYYRRLGSGQANLTIYRQTFNNSTRIPVKVLDSSDFLTVWQIGQIALTSLNNQTSNVYRLLFEATYYSGFGRLMLDDFDLVNGPCPPVPSDCAIQCDTVNATQQCIPTSKLCDFNRDCLNGADEANCGYNCDFERNLCGYTEPSAGAFKWQRQRAGSLTPGSTTGPPIDHTTLTGNGYYMIVSTNNGTLDDRAHLLSPLLQQSSASCELTFFYHMSGVNVGRLEVVIMEGSQSSRIWSIEGNRGDRWFRGVAKVGRYNRAFRARFDARKTATSFADITIDDIQWVGCNLPIISNDTQTCADNQFACARGGCIDQNRLCDYTDDCGDRSDERNSTCFRPGSASGYA